MEKQTFDNTIKRAAIRPATSHPGRIRRWLQISAAVAMLLVVGHIVSGDPLARALADAERAGWESPRPSAPAPTDCLVILICEMPL